MKEYMMTSTEFCKILGVKNTTYSQWENELNNPSMEKAFEIAKILNKRFEEIWFCE